MKKWAKVFGGALVGLVVVAVGSVGVMAASGMVSIKVDEQPVNFYFNQQNVTPKDGIFDNGGEKVPDTFIYEGTTYVPIRLVSNILNEPVSWDGAKHAVLIGQGSASVSLGAPYNLNTTLGGACAYPATGTMGGKQYTDSLVCEGLEVDDLQANYNLNGEYSQLTFTVGLDDENLNSWAIDPTVVSVVGDGKQLWSHSFSGSGSPITAQVLVPGVKSLVIEISSANFGVHGVDIANASLTP